MKFTEKMIQFPLRLSDWRSAPNQFSDVVVVFAKSLTRHLDLQISSSNPLVSHENAVARVVLERLSELTKSIEKEEENIEAIASLKSLLLSVYAYLLGLERKYRDKNSIAEREHLAKTMHVTIFSISSRQEKKLPATWLECLKQVEGFSVELANTLGNIQGGKTSATLADLQELSIGVDREDDYLNFSPGEGFPLILRFQTAIHQLALIDNHVQLTTYFQSTSQTQSFGCRCFPFFFREPILTQGNLLKQASQEVELDLLPRR